LVSVRTINLTKTFGDVIAVYKATLNIEKGEFFTLLGPSGCGKTTTLRMIAGFYTPDEGEIYFDDKLMNNVPPHMRNTGMVFQNYALWPHMTVFDNIAYGLKIRRLSKEEIKKRVAWALKLVKLEGLENRLPSHLSGGQQQRVALARALVIEPDVLLLDEPLSNLDAKLRIATRSEIKKIQKKLGITTIYVTHDQEEALAISDRIAVMNQGKIEQVGTPREIYEQPKNEFIADFIGVTNFLKGVVSQIKENTVTVELSNNIMIEAFKPKEVLKEGDTVVCAIRPEAITIEHVHESKAINSIIGKVELSTYLGKTVRYEVDVNGEVLIVEDVNPLKRKLFKEGEKVLLIFPPETVRIFK